MPKFFLNLFFIFLFLFSFSQKVSALECRNSPGGYCTYSQSDCTDNGGYVNSSYDCLGESAGDYCCFPGAEETPQSETCTTNGGTCVANGTACDEKLNYSCGSGSEMCCKTDSGEDANECSQKGGSCFPSSTACYGGTENELSYSCNSGQHCCKQTVNTCADNGGTCVGSGTACDKILQYSCGEGGGTCCDTGKTNTSGSGAWGQGLTTANKSANLPDAEIESVAENILTYTLSLFILFGVLFFVITGLKYIIAGSTGTAEKSKLGIQHLIIGITIGLSGYIIIKFINYILGG